MKSRIFWIFFSLTIIFFITSCNKETERTYSEASSTISVFGTGTVFAQPDMVQLSISLSNVNRTTRLAQEEVSRMTRQVLAILKDSDIEDKNISTASLSFRTEYDYRSGGRILVGQRAEQRLTFSIEDIKDNAERVPRIIDQLIGINGIELSQINFSIKNNTDFYTRSRELAYQKAVQKAQQYAELSNLKIVKVLSISEEGTQQFMPQNRMSNQMVFSEADAGANLLTVLPAGELEVTTRITVVFLLE